MLVRWPGRNKSVGSGTLLFSKKCFFARLTVGHCIGSDMFVKTLYAKTQCFLTPYFSHFQNLLVQVAAYTKSVGSPMVFVVCCAPLTFLGFVGNEQPAKYVSGPPKLPPGVTWGQQVARCALRLCVLCALSPLALYYSGDIPFCIDALLVHSVADLERKSAIMHHASCMYHASCIMLA